MKTKYDTLTTDSIITINTSLDQLLDDLADHLEAITRTQTQHATDNSHDPDRKLCRKAHIYADTLYHIMTVASPSAVIESYQTKCHNVLTTLTEALSAHAPAYYTFGNYETDYYGFYPDLHAIQNDIQDGTLPVCNDHDPPANYAQYVTINDHGNLTLYTLKQDGTFTQYLSIV